MKFDINDGHCRFQWYQQMKLSLNLMSLVLHMTRCHVAKYLCKRILSDLGVAGLHVVKL